MRPHWTTFAAGFAAGGILLLGGVELAGRLPAVRQLVCARVEAELATRLTHAHIQECSRVSVLGRFVDLRAVEGQLIHTVGLG